MYLKRVTKVDAAVIGAIAAVVVGIPTVFLQYDLFFWAIVSGIGGLMALIGFVVWWIWYNAHQKSIDLNQHPLWSHMDACINRRIPRIRLKTHPDDPNNLRTKLIRLTMSSKFEVELRNLKEYAFKEKKHNEATMKAFLTQTINDYEKEWISLEVPQIFIDKFYNFHDYKVKEFENYIEYICNSEFHDKEDRIVAFLDYYMHLCNETVRDTELANTHINGELTQELKKLRRKGKF